MICVHTVIFAKVPRAGYVKTRLIPALGAQGSALLAQRLLDHTIAQAMLANIGPVELCLSPPEDCDGDELKIPSAIKRSAQGEGDLGQRLARAAKRVLDSGIGVLLIGTDCPALDASYLRQIARTLEEADLVMAPAADGGYAALGLNRYDSRLFTDIPWSTHRVGAETLRRVQQLGWTARELAMLHDIDEPADLKWLPAGWSQSEPGPGPKSKRSIP